jgi:hypothetical protein
MNRRYRGIFITVLALLPVTLSTFTWRCNSVSFHLKTWGVEYSFEKGSCTTSHGQPQIELTGEDKQ